MVELMLLTMIKMMIIILIIVVGIRESAGKDTDRKCEIEQATASYKTTQTTHTHTYALIHRLDSSTRTKIVSLYSACLSNWLSFAPAVVGIGRK